MALIPNPIYLGAPLRRMPYLRRGLGDASTVLPAGTQLVYNATFTPGWVSPVATPASIAAAVAQNVSKNSGITVVGSNASTNAFSAQAAFTLTLSLNQPYTNAAMVQKVMDDAVSAATGGVTASNISVSGAPPASAGSNAPIAADAPGAGTPPPQNLSDFLAANWIWIAIGAGALLVLPEIL